MSCWRSTSTARRRGTLDATLAAPEHRIGRDGVLLLGRAQSLRTALLVGLPRALDRAGSSRRLPARSAAARPLRRGAPALRVAARALGGARPRRLFAVLEWFLAVPDEGEPARSGRWSRSGWSPRRPSSPPSWPRPRPSADRRLARVSTSSRRRSSSGSSRTAGSSRSSRITSSSRPRPIGACSPDRDLVAPAPPAPEVGWHYRRGTSGADRDRLRARRATPAGSRSANAGSTTARLPEPGEFSWMPQPESRRSLPENPLRLRLEEHLIAGRSERLPGRARQLLRLRSGHDSAARRDLAGEALDAIAEQRHA